MEIKTLPLGNIGANCYIISDEDTCVLVDPGASGEVIIEYLDELKLNPQAILVTHGHFDHIGAVQTVQEKYGAKVIVGEYDEEMLLDKNKSLAIHDPFGNYNIKVNKTVKDNEIFTVGTIEIEVLHTPGHTKGGVCYKIGDKLFTGDTLFYEECGRTDLYGGDYKQILQSLNRLATLDPNTVVYPGHDRSSTIGHEIGNNPYMGKH